MGRRLYHRWFWLQFPLFALLYQLHEWVLTDSLFADSLTGVAALLIIDALAVPLAFLAVKLDVSGTRTALFSVGVLVVTGLIDFLYMVVTTETVSAVAALVIWVLSVALCYRVVLRDSVRPTTTRHFTG